MNFIKFDEFKLTTDVKRRFFKIYESVISDYFQFNGELFLNTRKMLNAEKSGQSFKMDLFSYQLAFLLSFSVQDTYLSVEGFYQSLMDNTQIIQELSKKNVIKLLCLESESIPALIGVCQVIDELFDKFGYKCNFEYWEVRVSVIENRQNWRRLCELIVETVNSYYKNIELKLDFVDDFVNWSSQEVIDKESDLVIIARYFEKYLDCTSNFQFLKDILREMKEKAVMFWLDSYKEKNFKSLRKLLRTNSFSEVKSSKYCETAFKKLGDDEYYLDIAINWVTNSQPVMFLTWIKHANHLKNNKKSAEVVMFYQPNPENYRRLPNKMKKGSKKKGIMGIPTCGCFTKGTYTHKPIPEVCTSDQLITPSVPAFFSGRGPFQADRFLTHSIQEILPLYSAFCPYLHYIKPPTSPVCECGSVGISDSFSCQLDPDTLDPVRPLGIPGAQIWVKSGKRGWESFFVAQICSAN